MRKSVIVMVVLIVLLVISVTQAVQIHALKAKVSEAQAQAVLEDSLELDDEGAAFDDGELVDP